MIRLDLDHEQLRLGVVRASGLKFQPAPAALTEEIRAFEAQLKADDTTVCQKTRATIRGILRFGGYKPSGRGKPASELLQRLALEGGMPSINAIVDCSNFASLFSGYPISIFDDELLGSDVRVRFGRTGENYVFNASGHTMDVAGLPVVCRGDQPVGNAVKDSNACKVNAQTTRIVAVIYGSQEASHPLQSACDHLVGLLKKYAGAKQAGVSMIPE